MLRASRVLTIKLRISVRSRVQRLNIDFNKSTGFAYKKRKMYYFHIDKSPRRRGVCSSHFTGRETKQHREYMYFYVTGTLYTVQVCVHCIKYWQYSRTWYLYVVYCADFLFFSARAVASCLFTLSIFSFPFKSTSDLVSFMMSRVLPK